jgi:hypothetical protein
MRLGLVSHLRATLAWLKANWKDTFRSWDFGLAALAAVAAFVGTLQSQSIQSNGLVFLGAIAALGIALTAVVATVLTLVVTLFDDAYRQAIQRTNGGWLAAVRPYRVVAFLSVLTTIVAVTGLFVWGVAFAWLKALILASSGGLAIWALLGTADLIGLTSFHGEMRFLLLGGMDQARKALARRREHKQVG